MAVQALVGLFESRSSVRSSVPPAGSARTEDPTESTSESGPSTPRAGASSTVTDTLKPQSFLRRREPSHPDDVDEVDHALPIHAYSAVHGTRYDRLNEEAHEISIDITEEPLRATGHFSVARLQKQSSTSARFSPGIREVEDEGVEMGLLDSASTSRTLTRSPPIDSGIGDTSSITSSATVYQKHPASSSTTLVPCSSQSSPHIPIPVSKILARKALPLALPDLDNYISSLPAPSFPSVEGGSNPKDPAVKMFRPMDRLATSKKTLDDLEHNTQITPSWRNCASILAMVLSLTLGISGSSLIASFYSIQSFFDTIQIFALLLNTIMSRDETTDEWRTLFLVKIPNILALNFTTPLLLSFAILLAFMVFCGLLLYYFYRTTSLCSHQRPAYPKHPWLIMIVVFLLTVFYLPVSTMAVHVLVWSDDLWVVPNPYINATSSPPVVAPLGPADQYRDPLDFCYTTTMKRHAINYAPVTVLVALICFAGLTVWFPIYLYRTIRTVTPVVGPYTELGTKRSNSDMNREYQRLLERDTNPLRFLYSGYRRNWGTYQSIFLLAKLTTLLITAIVNPNNCLFRSLPSNRVQLIHQIILVVAMFVFLVLQCFLAPFINPINNASEWTSRLNYLLTSAVALGVALNLPGKNILNGAILYTIYIVTYGLNIYFTIINWDIMRRLVKKLARRIDFSIDVFSPRLDLSPSCPHTKRRIWQEAITTLFLTEPECEIPKTQAMEFTQWRDDEYPPYLLGFAGTPGERLVENLRILREVGSAAYNKAVILTSGPDNTQFFQLEQIIQNHYVGPDCYWKNPEAPTPKCTTFFGNAWWIPFPPTVVIRFDDGPLAVLTSVHDLETYVHQNSSHYIQRKRQVRRTLRALDGVPVTWPYDCMQYVGSQDAWCGCKRRFGTKTLVHYRSGVLRIKRRGHLPWEGFDIGSGFEVELTYAKDISIDGSAIGLNAEFDFTQLLARFFALNQQLIPNLLACLEDVLASYRRHCRRQCRWKTDTLSYHFLTDVYDRPRKATDVAEIVLKCEHDQRVRRLAVWSEVVFEITHERFLAVASSELATWWYIFWDDLWRRNYDTISALSKHATDFNPHYPSSIAYRPLPRAALEAFLTQRGLLHKTAKWGDFFHSGFLNKMYLRMNDIAFHGSHGAIIFHLGEGRSELDMEEIDMQTLVQPSTLGTGGGTDYDDESIRARPYYRWEGILDDPVRKNKRTHRSLLSKLAVWFGISPLWRSGAPSTGLALDVRTEKGHYVLLDNTLQGQKWTAK
ncbi:hypothetical protein B0H21DRAFT_723250 [Amylocystis lapponica]|nr:hypothetical protein B0H21DRAFT_723250 [Amylocystis lapponica]